MIFFSRRRRNLKLPTKQKSEKVIRILYCTQRFETWAFS